MSKIFLFIDGSKTYDDLDEETLNKTDIGSSDNYQNNIMKLISQSQYLQSKHNYLETPKFIQSEFDHIKNTIPIEDESIEFFKKFIQHEKVSLPIERFKDIYILSEYFDITHLTHELDLLFQKEFINNDLDFTIQTLFDLNSIKNKFETKLTNKIESYLSSQVNECIQIPTFSNLPISSIYRIFEGINEDGVNFDLLIDFIIESIENRFILFEFVDFQKLTEKKIEKIIKMTNDEKKNCKKSDYSSAQLNYSLIKRMKNENDILVEDLNKTRQELEQTKQEMNRTKQELEQTKLEMKQAKEMLERMKRKKSFGKQGKK